MKKSPPSLQAYMAAVIARLYAEERNGTAHVYQSSYNHIEKFAGHRPVSFEELTPLWINAFQSYLQGKKLRPNTISTYLRMLRAVYLRAVDEDKAGYRPRLFNGVFTGTRITVKRALDKQTLEELNHPVTDNARLESARQLFLLLFMLRGIPFVDMAYLRRQDLVGNRLTYQRRKTGTALTVCVEPEAMELINLLRNPDPASPYLLPLIAHPGKDEYKQYTHALRLFNHRLRKLSARLSTAENLSSYSARHSWATIANDCAYHQELIRDAMGHSSVKVTETYFRKSANARIDEMNRGILAHVFAGSRAKALNG